MQTGNPIPALGLFGEDNVFPNAVHHEPLTHRAPAHHWRIAPHRHSRMSQLLVLSSGQAQARLEARTIPLAAGDFVYTPAHCVHGYSFRPGSGGSVFSFPAELAAAIGPAGERVAACLQAPLHGRLPQRLRAPLDTLQEVCGGDGMFRTQQSTALAHFVLASLAALGHAARADATTHHGHAPSAEERLAQFDRLIAEHIAAGDAAQVTVAQYASALGLSAGHLNRLCRGLTGKSCSAYAETRLMDEACRLLAFTQLGIAQIGYRLGYADPSYFSRRFRTLRGQPPSSYRATLPG